MNLSKKNTLTIFLILGLIFGGAYLYTTRISKFNNLQKIWANYKSVYIDATSGRTIDEQRGGLTTSEGQSYTMLQSMWMNDREQFDKSWNWTKYNLQRKNDKLFSWEWGKKSDGGYGIMIEDGGENAAIDADIDIAYSLINANKKWNEPKYLQEAKEIITDIWNLGVIQVSNGKFVLAANNLEKQYNKSKIIVNPSYFAPYAFKLFANVTPDLEWRRLAEDCYFILNQISQIKVNQKNLILPPDWIFVDTKNSEISPLPNRQYKYSYDAVRIPWRIAMDYYYNKNPEALEYLRKFDFLAEEWKKKNIIYPAYTSFGEIINNETSTLGYSTSLGYFQIHQPAIADSIYQNKLQPDMFKTKSYYESNWFWFGLALYYKAI
jgi:endoglucanase